MAASLEQLDPFAKRPADSNAPGFLFELKPERADDYPGWSDLFIASTPEKELWQATHSSVPFYSCRFSRCGETFAYLKIDGKDRVAGKEVQQRGAIEDALQEVLERDGLGSVISGGTGIAYSYIELALTSMKSGAEAVVQALRGKVPLKSWLLFYDAPLADEWVGIYPETPVPPKVKTKT